MESYKDILPGHIARFVEDFDGKLSVEEFNSPKYAYRVLFTQKTTNHPGQADKVIEFVNPDSEAAKGINKTYAVIKEKEKQKYRATTIIQMMQDEGYVKFNQHYHTKLWHEKDGKNPVRGYGIEIEKYWYWYENWLNIVRQHCMTHKRRYLMFQGVSLE